MPRLNAFPVCHALGIAMMVAVSGCSEPEATPPAKPPIETRKTIGKTTQNVLDLAAAVADGGRAIDPTATREGLDTITGAYRSAGAQIGTLSVEHALKMYEAEHESRPATHAEFMAKIIRPGQPDGITLPMLPYYQEYAFDPEKRGLVIVDFPARREQREKETTGAAGL